VHAECFAPNELLKLLRGLRRLHAGQPPIVSIRHPLVASREQQRKLLPVVQGQPTGHSVQPHDTLVVHHQSVIPEDDSEVAPIVAESRRLELS